MSPGCGHNHTHNVVKLNSKKPFSKVPASITDAETKYIYRNRKGKMIFTPMFQVYKTLFTGEIVNNTRIKTAFNDFKDTAKYERYMLNAVQFSAAKTAAEGKLLQAAVFNENNVIKPFNEFKKDAQQITDIMNKTWLRTEYETARRQAVQGDQFARMQEDADLYPYWIYSGMMDDREREEHVELEGKVFRIGDPEGDLVFPPNGDNCRCTGDPIDAQEMKEKGLSETPKSETKGLIERNVDDRFRYNPANEGILPKSGSYFDVLPSANSADWEDFSDMQSSEVKAKEMTITQLMEMAKQSEPEIKELGESLAKDYGGYVTPVNLKSEKSIARKVKDDYKGKVSEVKDAVRSTVVLEKNQVEAAVNDLEKNPNIVKLKRQRHDTDMYGYNGNLANVVTKNGLIAEVQVNTPEMIYAKEKKADAVRILGRKRWEAIRAKTGQPPGMGHHYYEQGRVLDKNDPAQLKKLLEIQEKSKKYYANFK